MDWASKGVYLNIMLQGLMLRKTGFLPTLGTYINNATLAYSHCTILYNVIYCVWHPRNVRIQLLLNHGQII